MVVARETTLQELLEGTKQYQVPLYQRTYSWSRAQLERLWQDLVRLAEDRTTDADASHFIGSLVLAPSPANGPTGVQEYLVVDGQQRLTTLTILLTAIRDHRKETESPEHFERISEQYLINKWKQGTQRLKLLPTQADRASYQACIDATPAAGGADPVGNAYRFFKAALIEADDPDDAQDIDRIENAAIAGLALVSVTAQQGDNVHRIFESLNNTGLKLTQGDLLRNYLFMRMPTQADSVYDGLWLPLQKMLTSDELELLFWLDLVKADPIVKQTEIYQRQQGRLDRLKTEDAIKGEVERFARLGRLLRIVLHPAEESEAPVRLRLTRLKAWGTTTVYPILLHLLDERDRGTATSEAIAKAMLFIESFLVRRLLVGRATANINRILTAAVSELEGESDFTAALHRYLSTGRKHYANDADIATALTTVPFYLNGRPNQRKLVLQWIEESYGSKEQVDPTTLTIEHVLPQSLTDAWRSEITPDLSDAEDADAVHQALVHTLGNLTLTGYNSSLSNSPFSTKRTQLASSGIRMNQQIADFERWGRQAIVSRAEALARRIASIWPSPLNVKDAVELTPAWTLLARAVAELPPGAWTSYGDLAALIGSHPVPVGMRVANHPIENGHRVLQSAGTISPGFRWYEPGRTDDPIEVLEAEGIEFDDHGRANPNQRFTADDLASLLGDDVDEVPGEIPIPAGQSVELRDSFLSQLTEGTSPAETQLVMSLIARWTGSSGTVQYGTSTQTSCFLMMPTSQPHTIWPVAIYPTGWIEFVFQWLATRPPFDDIRVRDEYRRRLNEIKGVDIPAAKLTLRPSIKTEILLQADGLERLEQALEWFAQTVSNFDESGAS